MPYIDAEVYDDRMQVETSVLLKDYNSGSTVERGNDIMKIAKSSSVYNNSESDRNRSDKTGIYGYV